jgi:DNA-binding CsgD family transcriptional regulator
MARIESLRRAPDPPSDRLDVREDGWESVSPELLDLLSAGDPPAFATDSRERIVFWNRGAAAVLGRRSEEALGKHCYEVMCGRDVFGNRLCTQSCAIQSMARSSEPVSGFEVRVPAANGGGQQLLHVTILRVPGPRSDLFTLVHVVQPIDEAVRAAAPPAREEAPRTFEALRPQDDGPPLTPRETEVLQLVASGLQNKEIAQKLGLSLATVRNHVHNALEKLNVHSKLEMVSMAFRRGWVRRPASAGPAS